MNNTTSASNISASNILAKEKDIVVPGEELAKGMDYVPGFGTYRKDETIRAARLGLLCIEGRALKIIPLSGRYVPKRYDVIIGEVIDVTMNGWLVDTNSAYKAMLNVKDATTNFIERGADLSQIYDIGDYMVAKIVNVTSQKLVDLSTKAPGLKKVYGGRIIKVNPYKVPRIIGKQGSMVSMIKQATGCKIIVGQNGVIWLSGAPDKEIIAFDTIKKIEAEAHVSGLTEIIKSYLETTCGVICNPESADNGTNEHINDNSEEGM